MKVTISGNAAGMQSASANPSLVVNRLSAGDEAQWDEFVTAHSDANLYHSLLWRNLVTSCFGHEAIYVTCRRDNSFTGVLPLFLVRNPLLGAKLLSLPYDLCSGGPLALDQQSETALATEAIAIARSQNVRYMELRAGSRKPSLDGLSLNRTEPALVSETLLEGDVRSRISTDHLKAARKAKNRGIEVRIAESREEFAEFYEVYLQVFRAFGTPPYGRRYFELLYDRLYAGNHVRIFLARLNGRCVGGLQLFCWNRTLVSKFAACLPEAVPLRAYAALYAAAIEFGLESGYRRLNWGTSARNQSGLVAFKEGWAAQSAPVSSYNLAVRGQPPDVERYFDSQGLPQRIWQRLPLSWTRVLGNPINRWFC